MTTIITKQQRQRRKKESPVVISSKAPKKKITPKKKTPKRSSSKKQQPTQEELFLEHSVEEREKTTATASPKRKRKTKPKRSTKVVEVMDESTMDGGHTSTVNIVEELKENRELMNQLERGEVEEPEDFELPPLDFLAKAPNVSKKIDEEEIDRKVHVLLEKLGQFKISGEVMDIYSGPLVTTFEFKPAANVRSLRF